MREEGSVTPSLLLREHVYLGLEAGVSVHGAGLDDKLTAPNLVALHAAQQQTHIVTSLSEEGE